jgi:hypothetical protein
MSEWNSSAPRTHYASTWRAHFLFFIEQEGTIDLYNFWKEEELTLQKSLLRTPAFFNPVPYTLAWAHAVKKSELQSLRSSIQAVTMATAPHFTQQAAPTHPSVYFVLPQQVANNYQIPPIPFKLFYPLQHPFPQLQPFSITPFSI